MTRRLWPLLVLLSIAACSDDDDPVGPDAPMLRTITTESWDYLDNRFFRLDLPPSEADVQGYLRPDQPGRAPGERIDRSSIRIYHFIGGGVPQSTDLMNVAVTVDSTGRWSDLPAAGHAWTTGLVWRPVEFNLYLTSTNILIAVDLRQEMLETDLLGVVYDVVDQNDQLVYRVGENPHVVSPGLEINGVLHYRMKLLKPSTRDPFTYQYVLRNIYFLGAEYIEACHFDLVIERNTDEADADVETNGLPYLRIFGLDTMDVDGHPGADGIVDENDSSRFDLVRGLLRFPLDFPRPFDATAEVYAANAGVAPEAFAWDQTRLSQLLTPQIYDAATPPAQYPDHGSFRLIATVGPG